ncbi:alpha/beta hydrolase [Pseudoxanthomonas sp. JBR18]|uniref:alpha/beta fold hydrolase n=1 Tax=Pseudoxanthomonas sp. JBR18 TaxID=2969308 RepID=UPI0023054743|nr:alpha/beta hydrolase [Pseudoxanthomonas sp. JBR18]WCE05507.1 alpha/beta hydrolase [Pseudoxanthomonas sp. JBR18]
MNLVECVLPASVGALHALRGGDPEGPKVIALHGWLDNAASWIPLLDLLPQPLDVLALDLPGHGRSVHLPPGTEYSPFVAINAVLDAADALGWERFALLGHSMGAGISSLLAAACPQRVRRLVCIEALGGLGEAADQAPARMRDAIAQARLPSRRPLRVFNALAAPIRARMQANGLSEASARLLVERGVRGVDDGWVWSSDPRLMLPSLYRATHDQVDALVASIDCPAQVILATPAQHYFPEPLRSQRAARLRHGQVTVLPGHHHLHMDDAPAVAGVIGGFLGEA